ncbi:MAG: ribose-phosphate diphosphokinase [Gammaproteobacteria bacterium]|nr:ribose-phosphate diphosphokinase [Gammaproteobacteria bacterium]
MPNDIKLISGTSHEQFSRDIAEHLGLPLTQTEIIRFGNENIMFQCKENVRESDVFVVQSSCSPLSDYIVELLIIIDALKHASARRITAVLPYFFYARSDKKDRPRISITARLMADLLETAGADRVLTMNVHSPQVGGFFRIPVDQLNATPLVCDHLRNTTSLSNSVLVASDVSEAKDLREYANRLDLPIAIVDKRRVSDDERPQAVGLIGDVEGKNALLVDDEIASGGTMLEAARFLQLHGVQRIEAAAVHPVLSGRAHERITDSPIERLVVTDSIPMSTAEPSKKIETITVAPLFAEAIKAIHSGYSVSTLFK